MKKKLFFLFPILLFFSLSLIPAKTFVSFATQTYFKCFWGADLSFRQCYKIQEQWIFEEMEIKWNTQERLFIEKMSFSFALDPLKRIIDLSLDLKDLYTDFSSLNKIQSCFNSKKNSSFLSLNTNCSIENGTLSSLDFLLKFDYLFSGFQEEEKNFGVGRFFFIFEDSEQASIDLFHQGKEIKANIFAKNLKLSKALASFSSLFPSDFIYEIIDGEVNGSLQVLLQEKSLPQISGEMALTDFSFSHSSFSGEIGDVSLHFSSKKDDFSEIQVLSPSFLHLFSEGGKKMDVDFSEGKILFDSSYLFSFEGKGLLKQKQQKLSFTIKSEWEPHTILNILLTLGEKENHPMNVNLSMKKDLLFLDLHQFSFSSLFCFKDALIPYFPTFQNIKKMEGNFNASFQAKLENNQVLQLSSPSFQITQFHCQSDTFFTELKNLEGSLFLDFQEPSLWEGLTADLSFEEGKLNQQDSSSFLSLEGNLFLEKGKIRPSSLQIQQNGWVAKIDWLSAKPYEVIRCIFEGNTEQNLPFLSFEPICSKITSISSTIFISSLKNGYALDAECILYQNKEKDLVSFNIETESITNSFSFFQTFFEKDVLKLLVEFKENLSFVGQFHTSEINWKKYSFFLDEKIDLEAIGSLTGQFNQTQASFHLQAEQLSFSNPYFALKIPKISLEDATFTYHFLESLFQGKLSAKDAYYQEKNTGLEFEDTTAEFFFSPQEIFIENVQTNCKKIPLSGHILLQGSWLKGDFFSILINCQKAKSNFSNLASFLPFFQIEKPVSLPLEGDLFLDGEKAKLHFQRSQGIWNTEYQVEGKMENGRINPSFYSCSFSDLSASFFYDSEENCVKLSDLKGFLCSEKENTSLLYPIKGSLFFYPSKEKMDFSFSLYDHETHFLHLEGDALKNKSEIFVLLDPKTTSIGNLNPSQFSFSFNEKELVSLSLKLPFLASSLIEEMKRITSFSFPSFSSYFEKIKHEKEKGEGTFSLDYEKEKKEFCFELKASSFFWKDYFIDGFTLIGKKTKTIWQIETLQFNDIGISFEVVPEKKAWKVPFFTLQTNTLNTKAMDGFFSFQENLQAEIAFSFFSLELDHLSIPSLSDPSSLDGIVLGSFTLFLTPLEKAPFFHSKMNCHIYSASLQMEDFFFEQAKCQKLIVDSKEGIRIENMDTYFSFSKNEDFPNYFSLKKGFYSFFSDAKEIQDLSFEIPVKNSSCFFHHFSKYLPSLEKAKDVIMQAKKEGIWKGVLQASYHNPSSSFSLTLDKDQYQLFDHEFSFQSLTFDYKKNAIQFFAKLNFQKKLFWLSGFIDENHFSEGSFMISDGDPRFEPSFETPLKITWQYDEKEGLFVKKINGFFSGLHVQLERSLAFCSLEKEALQGSIQINADRLVPLLPPALAEKIRLWNVGAGYCLEGTWYFAKKNELPFCQFIGKAKGSSFMFDQYIFDELKANVTFTGNEIILQNIAVNDLSLEMHIPSLFFFQNEKNEWEISMETFQIKNFRPSLLFSMETKKRGPFQPFIIRNIQLEKLNGNFSLNSFSGTGLLTFSQDPKTIPLNPLIAIPAEILLRLGLDSHLLTPVTGKVHYRLEKDRIFFTKFKDMYSEGKGSRFYLAYGKNSSWMDLNGNLHIFLGMKQYNLFFKLAELFTVKVEGSLKEPIYSLTRQRAA